MTLCHRHSSSSEYHDHHHEHSSTTITTTISTASYHHYQQRPLLLLLPSYYYHHHHHHRRARLRTRVKLTNPLAVPNTCAVRATTFLTGALSPPRALSLAVVIIIYNNFFSVTEATVKRRGRGDDSARPDRVRRPAFNAPVHSPPADTDVARQPPFGMPCPPDAACAPGTLRRFRVTDIEKIWLPPHTQKPLRHPDGWLAGWLTGPLARH